LWDPCGKGKESKGRQGTRKLSLFSLLAQESHRKREMTHAERAVVHTK